MNYKPSTEQGVEWKQPSAITIQNPFDPNTKPNIVFEEAIFKTESDGSISMKPSDSGPASMSFSYDATKEFTLVDPATGKVVGKTTFAQIKLMLFSLYLSSAQQRDTNIQKQADLAKALTEQTDFNTKNPIAHLKLEVFPNLTVELGETVQNKATSNITTEGCGKITYTSSDENIVKVDSNGNVTAVAIGVANIIVIQEAAANINRESGVGYTVTVVQPQQKQAA